jgi:adenylate cyclase
MSIESINEQLLRSVGVGVALFSGEPLKLEFCNDVFASWIEGSEKDSELMKLFPDLDLASMLKDIDSQGSFTTELKLRKKRRTLVVSQTFTRADIGGQNVYVLECQNITRIRELESMIESYSNMVERNTREIQREKDQVEKLLLNIMPRAAYEEYRDFGVVSPQRYDSVTVLVLDFTDFAGAVERLPPATLVSELSELYSSFDRIGDQLDCERIRTTGDSYRCMAGMQVQGMPHAQAVAKAATRFIRYLKRRNENASTTWTCRIGIGTGPVVGSVVGTQKYVYDVFGAAVNAALKAQALAGDMEVLTLNGELEDPGESLVKLPPDSTAAQSADMVAIVES